MLHSLPSGAGFQKCGRPGKIELRCLGNNGVPLRGKQRSRRDYATGSREGWRELVFGRAFDKDEGQAVGFLPARNSGNLPVSVALVRAPEEPCKIGNRICHRQKKDAGRGDLRLGCAVQSAGTSYTVPALIVARSSLSFGNRPGLSLQQLELDGALPITGRMRWCSVVSRFTFFPLAKIS